MSAYTAEEFSQRVTSLFEKIKEVSGFDSKASLVLKENGSSMTTAAHPTTGEVIFFVGKGYADKLGEESLAFVLAHELGHAALGHAKVLSDAEKELGILVKDSSQKDPAALEAYSRVSKQTEFEADAFAFKSVKALGLDLEKALESLNALEQSSSFTHPSKSERLQAIELLSSSIALTPVSKSDSSQTSMGLVESESSLQIKISSACLVSENGVQKVLSAEQSGNFSKETLNAVFSSELKEITPSSETLVGKSMLSVPSTEKEFLDTMSSCVSELSKEMQKTSQPVFSQEIKQVHLER